MSTLKADTIQSTGGGPVTLTKQTAAKAWSNVDLDSFQINGSFNISTASDDGVGRYTASLVNNMSDVNYASTTGSTMSTSYSAERTASGQHTTGTCFLHNRNTNDNGDADADELSLVLTGDLA